MVAHKKKLARHSGKFSASRFLESRRGRQSAEHFISRGKDPPQDFWNRAVVARFRPDQTISRICRLKISGIAPWSQSVKQLTKSESNPPQDFWNRAVVAEGARNDVVH